MKVVGFATDSPEQLPHATLRPVLDLNDAETVVNWLTANEARFDYRPETFA